MATSAEASSNTSQTITTEQPPEFRCDAHSAALLKRLQTRQDLCDVVLIVGESGKRISAHRLILIASSDYFLDLLSEQKGDSKPWEITLNNVDGDALEKVVNIVYSGSLECDVDTMKTIITTANYLQLKEITESCCEFLQRHLQPSNCLAVSVLAEQLNLETLLRNVQKFICKNFNEVSNHPDLFLLSAKQLSELIASDDLDVPSEEFVFRVVMKWIEYEPENRRKYFAELLAQLRLPLLPSTFLAEKVVPLCNTTESQILVLNAIKSVLLPTSNFTQPRNNSSKSAVKQLWAICAQKEKLALADYNLRTKLWTIRDTPIEFRPQCAMTLMGEDLIMVGGFVNGSPVNTVTKLNLRTMTSSEMAPMKTNRINHAVAVLNGSIYAIGGWNGRHYLNSVERWDPVSRTWGFVPVMVNARQWAGVAVISNRLYVSGGCTDCYLSSMECYDPVENIWRTTALMKMERYSNCLASYEGSFFAICGSGDLNSIERYDPHTDTWTTVSCSPQISGYSRCASLGPDLFIYSKSKFYKTISESSCNNLKLEILPTPTDTFNGFECKELFAIPFEFRPAEKWFRNKEF